MYDTFILEAWHYFKIKQYDRALDMIGKALSERPDDGYAFYLRAVCLHDSGKLRGALEACEICLQLGYQSERIHYIAGHAHTNLNDFAEAERHLLEALRLNPSYASAIATYSAVMYKTGFVEKSDALMAEAARLDPSNAKVLEYRLTIARTRGTQKTKEAALRDYVENEGEDYYRLVAPGNLHIDKKQYKKAYKCFRQAFLLRPNNQELLVELNELERKLSPLFVPMRIFWHIPPIAVWAAFLAALSLFTVLEINLAAAILTVIYLIFLVYSWIVEPLYNLLHRKK